MTPIVVDFETDGIVGNPVLNPPKPCGVSIKWPGYAANYFAWGHPTGNNCTIGNGKLALSQVLQSGLPMLFHNEGFDISVWMSMDETFKTTWLEILKSQWSRLHDTLYLVFFADPYAPTFSLKPSIERYLGKPPTEQDELRDWILKNVPEATAKDWGAYISKAPGNIVAPYANADTTGTGILFEKLYTQIGSQGMGAAYDRERRMFPVTFNATRRGVRVDRERLINDTFQYTAALSHAEDRLCTRLGITRYQLEEDEEALKDGLERSGAVAQWVLTPKSKKRSLADGNLTIVIPEIRDLLDYRGALKTSLQTFMRPWIEFSRADNRLHPNWNQVRQAKGDYGTKGARTGRISSDNPNFQNMPTEWEYRDGTPMAVPEGLLPYPTLRSYILPEIGHVWLKRDFSAQEIRILAHFEDGSLKLAYIANPNMDPHEMARQLIAATVSIQLSRRPVKIIGFSIIYGSGGPGVARNLGVPIEQGKILRSAYLTAMPGVDDLMRDVQLRGRSGMGIRTWGGRIYLSEPSKVIDGRLCDFHYKLLNYLIQGSAADQTKDCINEWDERRGEAVFLATVHDEINISAPAENWPVHMTHLRTVMESDRFDVPFRTDGFVGRNWAELEACS